MKIRLNKAHYPVTTLGQGRRIGLWFQGCSIGCKGCISKDTWNPDQSKEIDLGDILAWCRSVSEDKIDGITITGGEPFEQANALKALLKGLQAWREELEEPFDILCYSGFRYDVLRHKHAEVLSFLDAIITGPYVRMRPGSKAWRGSDNQQLVPLSDLGKRLYGEKNLEKHEASNRLQVNVSDDVVWMIGIPKPGDMERLEVLVKSRGLTLKAVSWRA